MTGVSRRQLDASKSISILLLDTSWENDSDYRPLFLKGKTMSNDTPMNGQGTKGLEANFSTLVLSIGSSAAMALGP